MSSPALYARSDLVAFMGDLTKTETAILALVADGYTNDAIAVELGSSVNTVTGHMTHIRDKAVDRLGPDTERAFIRVMLARAYWEWRGQ